MTPILQRIKLIFFAEYLRFLRGKSSRRYFLLPQLDYVCLLMRRYSIRVKWPRNFHKKYVIDWRQFPQGFMARESTSTRSETRNFSIAGRKARINWRNIHETRPTGAQVMTSTCTQTNFHLRSVDDSRPRGRHLKKGSSDKA